MAFPFLEATQDLIIGPFMERDFIYTPLIILNFPMTDFKTQPIVVQEKKCELWDTAIVVKNNREWPSSELGRQ